MFPDRVISRRADHNYPPRSCDFTAYDFFLCGHGQDKMYANSTASMQYLKDGIRKAIEDIGQRFGKGNFHEKKI